MITVASGLFSSSGLHHKCSAGILSPHTRAVQQPTLSRRRLPEWGPSDGTSARERSASCGGEPGHGGAIRLSESCHQPADRLLRLGKHPHTGGPKHCKCQHSSSRLPQGARQFELTGGSGTLYSTLVKVTTAGVKGSAVRCLYASACGERKVVESGGGSTCWQAWH